MNLYIENDFLEKLEISGKGKTFISYHKLSQLISSSCSVININLNKTELEDEYNKSKSPNGSKPETVKGWAIKKIIDNQKYREVDFNNDIDGKTDLRGYYFTMDKFESIKHFGVSNTTIDKEKGVVSSHINKDCEFYSNVEINNKNVDKEFEYIIHTPPCNCMLYTDQYLFKKRLTVENFCEFLKNYMDKDLKIPFHLTIIAGEINAQSQALIDTNLKLLDGISNLEYSVLFSSAKAKSPERFLYTNTTISSFGHPFEEKKSTKFSQNYFANNLDHKKISQAFTEFKSDLGIYQKQINSSISSYEAKYGTKKLIYSNVENFKNRIFDVLEKI